MASTLYRVLLRYKTNDINDIEAWFASDTKIAQPELDGLVKTAFDKLPRRLDNSRDLATNLAAGMPDGYTFLGDGKEYWQRTTPRQVILYVPDDTHIPEDIDFKPLEGIIGEKNSRKLLYDPEQIVQTSERIIYTKRPLIQHWLLILLRRR